MVPLRKLSINSGLRVTTCLGALKILHFVKGVPTGRVDEEGQVQAAAEPCCHLGCEKMAHPKGWSHQPAMFWAFPATNDWNWWMKMNHIHTHTYLYIYICSTYIYILCIYYATMGDWMTACRHATTSDMKKSVFYDKTQMPRWVEKVVGLARDFSER